MATLVLAFAAGLLTILSPCVLPLAPVIVVGARARRVAGPLMLAGGLAVSFGLLGGLAVSRGFSASLETIRDGSAAVMVAGGFLGLISLLVGSTVGDPPRPRFAVDPWGWPLGYVGAGVALALGWAPCVGPTLGAAFALAAKDGSLLVAMIRMIAFAAGAAAALLILGCGLGALMRLMWPRAARLGRITLAVAFAATGLVILTGVDHIVEAIFVQTMPDWLVVFATRL